MNAKVTPHFTVPFLVRATVNLVFVCTFQRPMAFESMMKIGNSAAITVFMILALLTGVSGAVIHHVGGPALWSNYDVATFAAPDYVDWAARTYVHVGDKLGKDLELHRTVDLIKSILRCKLARRLDSLRCDNGCILFEVTPVGLPEFVARTAILLLTTSCVLCSLHLHTNVSRCYILAHPWGLRYLQLQQRCCAG